MSYTASALAGVAVAVLLDLAVLRTRLLTRRIFWVSYAITLGFQLVVNGVLTCRRVVVYDPAAIVGVRVACAPVEDLLFGFALVTSTLAWWVWWGRRLSSPPDRRWRGWRRASTPQAPAPGRRSAP
ncbi:MAG: lycopene cyclase domain-containing protein [Mycobacteriales bacterium]